jgi:hypothetical protein
MDIERPAVEGPLAAEDESADRIRILRYWFWA